MKNVITANTIGGLILCTIGLLNSSNVIAQGELRAEYGDWKLHCETPAGARSEQCALIQKLTAEDRPNISLQVILIKTTDNDTYIMRILAPLGVVLPSGLGLQIDNEETGVVGFVRCIFDGCVAEVILTDDLTRDLNSGTTATFILFMTPEEGIGIPIKLTGLAEGLEALKE